MLGFIPLCQPRSGVVGDVLEGLHLTHLRLDLASGFSRELNKHLEWGKWRLTSGQLMSVSGEGASVKAQEAIHNRINSHNRHTCQGVRVSICTAKDHISDLSQTSPLARDGWSVYLLPSFGRKLRQNVCLEPPYHHLSQQAIELAEVGGPVGLKPPPALLPIAVPAPIFSKYTSKYASEAVSFGPLVTPAARHDM